MRKNRDDQIRELEERLEALIIAIPKEEAAYHFYRDLADRTSHEGTRKMFLQLAEQERGHRHNLEKFTEEITREVERLRSARDREKRTAE